MDTEVNKGVVRRYVDEVFNAGNLAIVEEIVDENIAYREAGRRMDGRDAFKQGLSAYLATFGDPLLTVDDLAAEADRVAFRWTMRGTHVGPLMGVDPTGKEVTFSEDHLPAPGQRQDRRVVGALGRPGAHAATWRHHRANSGRAINTRSAPPERRRIAPLAGRISRRREGRARRSNDAALEFEQIWLNQAKEFPTMHQRETQRSYRGRAVRPLLTSDLKTAPNIPFAGQNNEILRVISRSASLAQVSEANHSDTTARR